MYPDGLAPGAARPSTPGAGRSHVPGGRYRMSRAHRIASIVSSTVSRTVVSYLLSAPPPEIAMATQVGYDARVLTAEVTFPAPREGVRIRRVGVHELNDGTHCP